MERIITYDLKHKSSSDYADLYSVFKKLNGKQLTESSYVIDTNLAQKEIISLIKKAVYSDDKIYYISVDSKTSKLFYNKI